MTSSDLFYEEVASGYIAGLFNQLFESSLSVTTLASQVYWESWQEMFFSPQRFVKRNLNYLQEVTTAPFPAWQTSYRAVNLPEKFSKLIKLLDFSLPPAPDFNLPDLNLIEEIIPTVILPPQAGHHSFIADYSPEQSQVQALRKSGLSKIYCMEWVGATRETRHTKIEDYISAIHYTIERLGGKANLVGDCQGGWLAAIYAALYPESVNSLVLAGAPIDFQAGDGPIKASINYFARTFPDGGMAFYRGLVALGNGVLEGRHLINGFNMMRPAQVPERFLNLYRDIDNPAALKRYREMKNWYDYTQDISGDFYLWLVQHLFRDNELIQGKLLVGGERVNLKKITCPLFLLGGSSDHITPAAQVFALASYVGTPSEIIEEYLVDAGHIGLFMGHEVLKTTWRSIGEKLSRISRNSTSELRLRQ